MPLSDIIGHERPTALLRASIRRDRVAQAYLFFGEDGIGKRLTAFRYAQALNCDADSESGEPDACGKCRSCLQIEAQTHPDFLLVEPDYEQSNPQIKIERIRELEQQVVYRPLVARFKCFIIDEADRMTLSAANALLKTLEEPPSHSLFILITSRPSALPATIASRCCAVRFVPPTRAQVEAALVRLRGFTAEDARLVAVMTESRIGRALKTDVSTIRETREEFHALLAPSSLQSPAAVLSAADALAKAERVPEALHWIACWLRDILLLRVGADPDLLMNGDDTGELRRAAERFPPEAVMDLLSDIESIEQATGRNINPQIAMENVLLRIRDALGLRASAGSRS